MSWTHTVPTRAEERDLIRRAQSGDVSARNEMVDRNMGIVFKIAMKHRSRRSADFDDLIQDGSVGLMIAVSNFDLSRDTRFSTYAVFWVRQRIQTGLSLLEDSIHIPRYLRDRPERRKQSEFGDFAARARCVCSLHVLDQDVASAEPIDCRLDVDEINSRLDSLPPRQQVVIRARYGIGCESATLRDIGEQFGISKERVRQIQRRAERHLRNMMDGQAGEAASTRRPIHD